MTLKILALVALLGFVLLIVSKKRQQNKVNRKKKELRDKASWMANFFGTWRADDYQPASVKDEATKMLAFLHHFHGGNADYLKRLAGNAFHDEKLPFELNGNDGEYAYRARAIGDVSRAYERKGDDIVLDDQMQLERV